MAQDDIMTRPNIVRADTIDLQDQDNPSAAEHQKPSFQGGLAPHQRAEVHHVLEERDEEEQSLADAWTLAGSTLADEPGVIDQVQQQNGETTNGTHNEGEDGGAETETEGDEDMMDRISSSPSIDDGGYIMHSSPPPTAPALARVKWPERTSSLSPSPRNTPTPTRETFNQSPSSSPDSSPFLQTPLHLPLHVRRTGKEASGLAFQPEWSSSPFGEDLRHSPIIDVKQADNIFSHSSKHHHETGRYTGPQEPDQGRRVDIEDTGQEGIPQAERLRGNIQPHVKTEPQRTSKSSSPVQGRCSTGSHPDLHASESGRGPFTSLEPSPSLNSIVSMDLQDVLLPLDDPLLDTPPSPTGSTDSWESLPSSESDSLETSMNDDDTDALFANLEPRFIDSGWGGECLRDTEDIDFEFVYALHTFVATVEGQANATKGDTMVLLDDSNSYWWLVRVVKDSSIGYLPAEHIETPTERLARLNKHRNIDLSATMLSDNSEKTRNPLRKAMRRRNAKTVQFAAPTYVEASDYEYETEDEDQPANEQAAEIVQVDDSQQNGEFKEEEEAAERRTSLDDGQRPSSASSRASFDREQAATVAAQDEEPELSPKLVDKSEAAPLKSRKSRNTDSFLKDDSIETRKITLTPGLLREESVTGKSSTSTDSTRNNSLESLVKQVSPPEPLSKKDSKKEKEKKEKKGGMLSGLFKSKKKDKKAKDEISDLSDAEKYSAEFSRQSPITSPITSGRGSPNSSLLAPTDSRRQEVQTRQPSRGKLQKQPPSKESSPMRDVETPLEELSRAEPSRTEQSRPEPSRVEPSRAEPSRSFIAELQGSEAATEMAAAEPEAAAAEDPPEPHAEVVLQDRQSKEGPLSPITNILKRDDSKTQKPTKARRSKTRVELDDFDDEEDPGPNPFKEQEEKAAAKADDEDDDEERLSESPIEITHNAFMHGIESIHIPTPSPYDQVVDDDEEPESLTSSPSIIEHPAEPLEKVETQQDDDPTPTGPRSPSSNDQQTTQPITTPNRGLSSDSNTSSSSSNHLSPSTTVSQQTWSDSSLRSWLEDGSEVRNMMVMIHDKSGLVPVSDDHPMMAGLFTEQKKGVQDMMGQLDGLLGSYLSRKGIVLG